MKHIRPAETGDVCRLSEIEVFNYRLNFYPIFQNDEFYFKEYTTEALAETYKMNPDMIKNTFVFDDGCVKGFIRVTEGVVQKLFVEPVLQGRGIGEMLLTYAVREKGAYTLWALEKNTRAIAFYEKHGFSKTGDKMPEDDTDEFLIRLERRSIMRAEYQNITIRNAEKADCQQLAAWWNDGSVMAHAGFPMGLNTNEEKIWESIKTDTDDTRRRLILEYENAPIGEMNYRNQGNGVAEIGVKICERSHQEKGIGRKALSLLIQSLFQMGYTKIILDTNLTNTRAQHVYELLGFQKTGVRIDSWRDQLGNLQSAVDYELTKEDFHSFL